MTLPDTTLFPLIDHVLWVAAEAVPWCLRSCLSHGSKGTTTGPPSARTHLTLRLLTL